MKRAVLTLWLLLAAAAVTAQSEPTPPEFEYSDLQRLTPEDYIDMQLPPLHVLMENARHAPQVGYYESNREIEERELKTVRRNWMRNFKLNANYNYGSSDIYNQNYQDSNIPIWTTTTTGREQSWWNVGASFSIPLDEIFNRRNKIKQQKKRIENTQYDLDRWYDELRMKIIDAYTTAVEQLSILRSAAEAKITSEAQYRMTEVDFVKGKLDAQTLSRQKSLENSATREYEQVRRNLEDSLRDYNVQHRVINYDEQTKHIAALSRDYELRYEEILLNFESAEKLRASIEGQLEGLQETFRNNAEFIEKLHKIGSIYSRLSAAEAFQPETDGTEGISDRTAMPASRNDTGQLRRKLSEETRSLQELTTNIANQQYTKEGLSANTIVTEWLAAVLLAEKSRAELAVMKLRKQELDQKYTQFSPVGSTLKRKGREINFSEQSYLSILTALNTARLRQKNLQMTSATLKIINAPVLPLEAEPSKRKMMVAAAGLATLLFVLGFFILLELLDRTLRDKVRAERITKGRVIGAFPGKAYFGQRRFTKQYREIASRYIGNAAVNYFDPAKQPNVLNILSTERGDGKSLIAEHLAAFFREADMKVRIVSWNKDFDIERKEYLLAEKLGDFVRDTPGEVPLTEADVVLVEYPPFATSSVPKELLRHAALSIVIAPANRTWKDTDQLLFEKAEKLSGRTPVVLCLNCAGRDVVQTFTGLMPPYSRLRRLGYQISQFGFTAVK